MTNRRSSDYDYPASGSRLRRVFRPYFSGILPLFITAHFGHHVVGAMIRPLMPMMRTDLGLSYTQAGLVMSAFAITNGISQLPAGWLADRFGARLMVLLGVAGIAIAGFFIGFSNSFLTLVIFLIISAVLGGGYHPASAAAISMSVPDKERGRALGVHLIGGSSSFWVVPLLVAVIAAAWGWRSCFLILTIPTIALGILLYILIGKRSQAQTRRIQEQEINGEIPKTPTRIRWRRLAPFMIMSVAMGTMSMSVMAYLSLFAVDSLGVSETAAALLMAVTPAVGLFAAPFGGYLSDRFGSVKVLVAISIFAIPLVFLLGMASSVVVFVIIMVALGLATNARMPTSESFIAGYTPENRRATLLGLYFFAGTEVAGLLTPVLGKLIDMVGFQSTFAITAGGTGIVVAICAFFLWINRANDSNEGKIIR